MTSAPSHSPRGVRIGVDVGGTFTDLVVVDESDRIHVQKVPSNPQDPAAGVIQALESAARSRQSSVETLRSQCALVVHGSTIATNIVLERKRARVGPAASGLGGEEATVTGALIVLGRLRPGPYAGGSACPRASGGAPTRHRGQNGCGRGDPAARAQSAAK